VSFKEGKVYTNQIISSDFHVQTEGGIRYAGNTPDNVLHAVVFTGFANRHTRSPYADRWLAGRLWYTGEGLRGDQKLARGNLALARQMLYSFPLHVFRRVGTDRYRYLGMFKVLNYYQETQPDANGHPRSVYVFEMRRLGRASARPKPLASKDDYLKELATLKRENKKETVKLSRAKRNALLAQRLKQLYGYACQLCFGEEEVPPIPMKDGSNYVEVHHIRGFNEAAGWENSQDEGEYVVDDYENMVVLCPHHHRLLHHHKANFAFDADREQFVSKDRKVFLKLRVNLHLGEATKSSKP